MRLVMLAMLLFAAALLVGCASDTPDKQPAAKKDNEAKSDNGGPAISITSPDDGAEIQGTSVLVETKVTNFKLSKPEPENETGVGHLHLTLTPVEKESRLRGSFKQVHAGEDHTAEQEKKLHAGEPVGVESQSDQAIFNDVPPGDYSVTAELVENDHSSLNPPVRTMVSVTVVATDESDPQSESPSGGPPDPGRGSP